MSLEYLVPKISNCLKNDGEVSKGQRGQLEEVPTVQSWKNVSIKINDSDRSSPKAGKEF